MGQNISGQLGDGTMVDRHTPIAVASNGTAVAAGWNHSLFVKTDATLWGMGRNQYGEFGSGTPTLV